jgi:imidazole glycerol-phosphate synthase subunit HisH
MKVVIIDYKCGNVQSVRFAVERLGFKAELSDDKDEILQADKVIFPGVGNAGFAMNMLKEKGLDVLIKNLKQPVLGICLGMQLLCETTEESNAKGLGIFPVPVKRFIPAQNTKVPQVGWNKLKNYKGILFSDMSGQPYAYFVHSYYAELSEYTVAECVYGQPFSAALQKDNFFASQFHPEKSADVGETILNNFLML